MSRVAKVLEINFRFQDEGGREFLVTYCNPRNAVMRQMTDTECVSSTLGQKLNIICPTMLQCQLDFEAWANANGEIFTITEIQNEESSGDTERNTELEAFLDTFTIMKKG